MVCKFERMAVSEEMRTQPEERSVYEAGKAQLKAALPMLRIVWHHALQRATGNIVWVGMTYFSS